MCSDTAGTQDRSKTMKTNRKTKRNYCKGKRNLLFLCIVLVITATIALGNASQSGSAVLADAAALNFPTAAQAKSESVAVADEAEGSDETAEKAAAGEQGGDPNGAQTITFKKDIGVRDALRVLSARYHKNIVPSPKVDGQLAFTTLYDVTFDQAMDAILGENFRWEQQKNLIKVYTTEEYRKMKKDKERMIHRVFTLYYISAAEAIKLVTPVLSEAALVQGSSPAQTGVSVGDAEVGNEVGGDSMALHDQIVVFDYPENIEKAAELIDSIDDRPEQVLVEATIMSAKLTDDMKLGVNWNVLSGVDITGVGDLASGAAEGLATTFSNVEDGLKAGITSENVQALITALDSTTDTTILANPKILALNKQVGTVFIGDKVGYRESSSLSSAGTEIQGAVKFLDGGTKLSFRPYIGDDGYIRMDIYPKDSTAFLDDNQIPQETSTELSTNIIVKDGQTVVIGGLFRDKITTTESKVPLLGDLPLVGALFGTTGDKTERDEIIIMLTPHIVDSAEELNSKARAEDIRRKAFAAEQAIEWPGRHNMAEEHYNKAAKLYADGNPGAALEHLEESLRLSPTHFESLRLRDRILKETQGEDALERKTVGSVAPQGEITWNRQ